MTSNPIRRFAPPLFVAVVAFTGAGCGEAGTPTPSRAGAPDANRARKTEWSPDEMAADPAGYLTWAKARLEEQRKTREARLAAVAERKKEILARREKFSENVDGCGNIAKRMRVAIRKAEEEDRPINMAGRTFDRTKADQIVTECERRIEERKPFLQVYDDALSKLEQVAASFRKELEELARLKERLELDLERVRLSQGVAEIAQLKKTEAEIAHYAKIVASVAEDAAPLPAASSEPAPVDLDALLK
jgi:hypothetical protein